METTEVRRWTEEEFHSLFDLNRPKHKIKVFNREDFEEYVKGGLKDNEAYIEVFSGPCGKPIIKDTERYPEGEQVLRMDFEDLPEEMYWPGCEGRFVNPTITYYDAKRAVLFIEKNEGKDFIIHCDAGVSRSQQIAGYILITKWWDYEYDEYESSHPHRMPNTIVLTRLLMAEHSLLPRFTNRDGAFHYDGKMGAWVHRDYKKEEIC